MQESTLTRGESETAIVRFVGQPLIDVGVATIMAFSGRDSPERVTREDLDKVVSYILSVYTREPIKSFLTAIYPNSAYINFNMGNEKRKATIDRYLRGYATSVGNLASTCAFCGQPACDIVYRQHIPLTAGEGQINFGPGGRPGVPVCGGCLLASQAFPLGCVIKCAGRVLMVHSDNPVLTYAFASAFLRENRRILSLVDASGETKISFPRTIVVSQLIGIQDDRQLQDDDWGSLTAYHLTNLGASPDVTILHLPSETITFLRTMHGDKYRVDWQAIVARAWIQPKAAKTKSHTSTASGENAGTAGTSMATVQPLGTRKNALYEELFDLFAMPQNAAQFVRRFFMRRLSLPTEDAGNENGASPSASRVSWDIVDVFLRKVLKMERYRIEAISNLGDRLAAAIDSNNDARLLASFYSATRPGHLRAVLLKANNAQLKTGASPLFGFDDFITIFEGGEDISRSDWSLARDLIYIRVLDRLYASGWFQKHSTVAQDALERMEEKDEAGEREAVGSQA